MTVDELNVLITANTSNIRKEIQDVKNQLVSVEKTATKSSASLFKTITKSHIAIKLLSTGFGYLKASVGDAVSRLDALNNFPKVMSNLGISNEDAEASMKRLSDGLVGLPTTLDSATQSVQRFTSANGNVKASTEMFLALNNAILSGGASSEIQKSALEQLSQAYAKGKPDMMEWRTAMTAMPAQLKQVAIAMGYASASDLGEAIRGGTVSMNEFMGKIIELNKHGVNGFQSFEEQALNSTGGVNTSITNLKTAFTRGVAEIMNAIGQSNIAGFFNGIARAINAVIPYITGFVKACVWAVSSISSLFGGSTSKKIDNTKKSLSNLGSSGGGSVAKGLDKATGSAKKLNKELHGLASFDEMNVLKENDSSSDGGSGDAPVADIGAGDLSAINFGDFDASLDKSGGKVDEFYEKLVNTFKWFSEDMNLDPLVNSFHNLGDAISYLAGGAGKLLGDFIEKYLKPILTYRINEDLPRFFNILSNAIKSIDFTKIGSAFNKLWDALVRFDRTAMDVILWFFEKVIVPISKVIINDVLPGFLKLLAGAIDVLTTAIDIAKPAIKWLWEKFLEPVVTWTGGVIGDVLGAIGDALSWISKNEIAVAVLEAIVGVLGVLTGVIAAISAVFAIWNVVAGIAEVVTTALGVAFTILTSPITWIILGIVALVAGIILLVKHFDEVKLMAEKVWNKIAEIWGVVADWFNKNVIEPIKKIFSPIVDFFGGIFKTAIDNVKIIFDNLIQIARFVWNGIKIVFSVVADWFKEKWGVAVNAIKIVFEPIKNFFGSIWDGIKNVFSTVGNFFKDIFTKAYVAVKTVFEPIVNFFGGIFDKVKNIFRNIAVTVGNVISGAFKGVINGILGTVERVLNTPIMAVNGLIDTINKVPGLSLTRLHTFNLPRMARGGIVDRPTVAMIGEAGKEAVIPLENNTGGLERIAEFIGSKIGENNQPIKLVIKLGEDTIFDKFIDNMKERSFESNGEVYV